jgi:phage/conjugal plasmid C-4 type zinc finger TraR family protein
MTDIIDRAQQHETFRREIALRAARAKAQDLSTPSAFGLCDDCSDPIDAERRRALPGARRCIFCQEAAERGLRTQFR